MNKKNTRRLPFMVLALVCISSAGVLTACDNGSTSTSTHTHSYTEWNHNDTEHWKECPDDHTIDETTRGSHEYVVGECECGAIEPVVPVKYGKITGKVKLHKQGTFETDYTGVNIDLSDDGAELDFDTATGVFTFENVKVGENHILTITKSGYKDYTISSVQVEEDQTANIGGEDGIVLEYDVFGYLENYDTEYHDFSKVNEENPSIKFKDHEGNKTLNVLTKESYTNVSASFRVNWNNSTHNWHTQGIVLKFEDGNHAIIRYHNGDQENGNIQYANSLWSAKAETSIFAASDLNEWGEKPVHTLLSSETEVIKNGEGLDLTVVVNDGKIYTYFADNWVATYSIPEETVGKKVQVAYFAYDAANNAVFNYKISEAVPSTTSQVKVTVNKPTDPEAETANVVADKESCGIGEQVTLSITKPLGYKLDTLLVNNIDMAGDVVNNSLTVTANRSEMNIVATFVKEAPMAINIAMKGKKFGKTTNLAENTVVTFKNTDYSFTVNAEGNITNDSVVKGRYTVVVDGYFEKDIVLDENLQEIVLEYDAFRIVRWDSDGHDLTHVNDENPYVEWKGPGASLNMISKQNTLSDAIISVNLKGNQTTNGEKQQGVLLGFEDGKAAILNINIGGTPRLQFRPELFSDNNDPTAGLRTAFEQEWVEFKNVTTEEVNKYNSDEGVELKVARNGCNLVLFLDDRYVGTANLPSQYADDKMGFGFFAYDVVKGSKWYFDVSETLPSVTITDKTNDANGTLEISDSLKLGSDVTVTAKPNAGYKLASLTLDGNEIPLSEVKKNVYTFVATKEAYEIAATFELENKVDSVAVSVTGNKLGVTGNSLNGETVTLSDGTHTYSGVVKNGVVTFTDVEVGKGYSLSAEGYTSATGIEVTKEGIANEITLEYNTFHGGVQGWGEYFLENQNQGKIAGTNECESIMSNDYYGNMAFSMTISGSYADGTKCGGNQGIAIRFEGGGYVLLRMEGRQKVQFAEPDWFQNDTGKADGATWKDLIFFSEGDEYLTAYDAGTLKLTVLRQGNRFLAYLNGKYIGDQTVNEKYASVGAQVGIYWYGTQNGARKDWNVELETDTSSYEIPA